MDGTRASEAQRPPTLADVARRAGVSISSVSRHVRGEAVRTGPSIERAIEELGFRPSAAAQALKSGRTMSVALVVPDVTNPFFAAVVRGAEAATAEEGYTVLLANTDESPERERIVLDGLLSRVDGVLLAPALEEDDNPQMLQRAGIPVVFIDRQLGTSDDAPQVDTVLVDNRGGARSAVRHLADHGHRDIAIISGPDDTTPGRERLEAFRDALDELGLALPEDFVQDGGFREAGGYQAMLRLLGLAHRPTAVLVANNLMTLGALQALGAMSVAVPDELSLVGFDDHPWAGLLASPLTVVDRPMEEQGALAMRLLLNRITGRDTSAPKRIVLDTRLVERSSCGAPRTGPVRAAPAARARGARSGSG